MSNRAQTFYSLLDSYSYEFPLDTVTGAGGAWSIRKLSSTYTGNCIKIRRDKDNTELDIGFVNNFVDKSSIESFVGATGAGYVTTWYDQTGNNRNFTQTAAAQQPTVASAGAVLVESGIPYLQLTTSKYMDNSWSKANWTKATFSIFFATSTVQSKNDNLLYLGNYYSYSPNWHWTGLQGTYAAGTYGCSEYDGTEGNTRTAISSGVRHIMSAIRSATLYTVTKNMETGATLSSLRSPNINSAATWRLNRTQSNSDGADNHKINEIIIYNSDQTALRDSLVNNMNKYLNVY